jgi:hypothetical protein
MSKNQALSWEEPLSTRISQQFHRVHLEKVMHVHVRIHHWVLWWFYVGVACGVVALSNILLRDLSRTQEKVILVVGVLHWLLGGLVCYACEGIQVQEPPQPAKNTPTANTVEEREWYPASYFVLPGRGGKLLSPK